ECKKTRPGPMGPESRKVRKSSSGADQFFLSSFNRYAAHNEEVDWNPITFDTSTSQSPAYKVFFHASSRHLDGCGGICRFVCTDQHGSGARPFGTQGSQQNRSLLSRNGEAHAPWWCGQAGSCRPAKWDG